MGRFLTALVLLVSLSLAFAEEEDAVEQSHLFWGLPGDGLGMVSAVDATGSVVAQADEQSNGIWTIWIHAGETSRILLRDESFGRTIQTLWFDVQPGQVTQVMDYEFGTASPGAASDLSIENPQPHRIAGSGLPDGTVAAVLPAGETALENVNRLVQIAQVVNAAWSMRIPGAGLSVKSVVFETRIDGHLHRTPRVRLTQGGTTALSREDFRPIRRPQVFWGTDIDRRYVRIMGSERGDRGVYGKTSPEDGRWTLVLTEPPDYLDFVVLESGDWNDWLRTIALAHEVGTTLEIRATEFAERAWPGPPQQDGQVMEAALPQPHQVELVVLARLRENGSIEFGARAAHSDDVVYPRRRYLHADAPKGRWLLSTPFEIDGVLVGRIIARRLANGATEFGIRPDQDSFPDVFAAKRYFPANATVDHWLKTGILVVPTPQ